MRTMARLELLGAFVVMLTLPTAVQAQDYICTNNNGKLTITGYTGADSAATIPSTINGLLVTGIGDDAFQFCTNLTSIAIPDSVTNIGDSAFQFCTGLTSITIPNSVTSIGDWAFEFCTSLTSIMVDTSNSAYSSSDGVLFDKSQTTLIQCPGGKTGSYTIPSSVTSVGDDAFDHCANLTALTVTASNSAYSSSDGVLFDKSQTTLIQCPGGKTGSYTIPGSVTIIGDNAFDHCANLTSITLPDRVTSIGDSAFQFCTGLTSITIPSGVTTIGDWAFEFCYSLTSITVDANNPAYSSLDGVLFDKGRITLIQCPGGKSGSYTIPNSVTIIGDGAFADCDSLTNITITGGVTSIEDDVFNGCTSLISITIPSSVTNVGDNAFQFCTSLNSLVIPSSVTSIGDDAFDHCTSLTSITVDTNNSDYSSLDGVLFDKSQTSLIQCPGGKAGSYTTPGSVTNIVEQAFYNCSSLTSITIPVSVTSIRDDAFDGCIRLTSVTIGKIRHHHKGHIHPPRHHLRRHHAHRRVKVQKMNAHFLHQPHLQRHHEHRERYVQSLHEHRELCGRHLHQPHQSEHGKPAGSQHGSPSRHH